MSCWVVMRVLDKGNPANVAPAMALVVTPDLERAFRAVRDFDPIESPEAIEWSDPEDDQWLGHVDGVLRWVIERPTG